ncbi:DUF6714 family protein [Nevskia soli]|uniref:DUF6714 family protein n=1 Tax=Nevskia soli TaxID=418856 RepID=UPI0004A7336A|nr:DUF6714 family protein [Nevskia soli]
MSAFDSLLDGAFPLKPFPDMTLRQAVLADQTMSRKISEDEWDRAADLDRGRTWRSYSDDELIACSLGLAHLSESGFVYYIPAFMSFACKYIDVAWPHKSWELVGAVVFGLTNRSAYNLSRLKQFSTAQRDVVVQFLELVARSQSDDATEAKKALARYWKTDEATKPLIIVP